MRTIILSRGSKSFRKLDKLVENKLSAALATLDSKKDHDVSYLGIANFQKVVITSVEILDDKSARDFGGKVFTSNCNTATYLTIDVGQEFATSVLEGVKLSSYVFDKYKSKKNDSKLALKNVKVKGVKNVSSCDVSESVNFARDLVSEPGNALHPLEYATRLAEQLTPLGIKVKVYSEDKLAEMGFNLLLSVGQGSSKQSHVVVMEWMGGKKKTKPIAYVGKGVTFDTGGISIKPSAGMGDMKFDMGGSAAVVGAMHAIATHKIAKNVIGIVGLVENMPDGNSIKPGDIVASLSGMTVENLNTDAEGRLVLADLLTYVQNTYEPSKIIDLATLTGAILVSLGHEMAGLFTNSSELSNTITAIGELEGERYWRMPMGQEWNKLLESDIADVKNIGGRYGGSTTAAEFLYRFVDQNTPWAHLDIAGTAWTETPKPTNPKGATGFGVRTLFKFAQSEAHRSFEIDEDMNY